MGLKFIYTVFIGLLLAAFVGVGIATFYVAPKQPDYPETLKSEPASVTIDSKIATETSEQKQARLDFDKKQKDYQTANNVYNRNVSVMAIIAAILILIISLFLAHSILVIADGLLLGGTLTLFYAIVRGFMTEDLKYRFIMITIGLVVTLVVGYLKFIKQAMLEPKTETRKH